MHFNSSYGTLLAPGSRNGIYFYDQSDTSLKFAVSVKNIKAFTKKIL